MRYFITSFLCFAIFGNCIAQFSIGNLDQTFNYTDASGTAKVVDAEIYYPTDNAGTAVPIAVGSHPVIVLGHGFLMTVDAYYNYRDYFVPKGYILVLPTSEGSFSPNHGAFGEDLVAMGDGMLDLSADASSIFNNAVNSKMAVVGHSMGGGASFLAAASSNSPFTTMINFAAAETTPSAIAAAANINIPALVFAGDEDCVAPPTANQEAMYNALPDCKAYSIIEGGSHCQFANSNVTCEAGEIICFGATFIARAAQHAAIFEVMEPWLNYFLMEDAVAGTTFQGLVGAGNNYTLSLDCPDFTTLVSIPEINTLQAHFNQSANAIIIDKEAKGQYHIIDQLGRVHQTGTASSWINVIQLPPGIYIFYMQTEGTIHQLKFLKFG